MFSPGRDISLRRMILLATDAIALAVSIFSATMWRLGPQQGILYVRENLYSLAASGLVFLVVFYGSGMYERASLVRRSLSFRLPLIATLISLAIITALFYAKSNIYVGRGILLIASGAVFLLTWFTRYLYSIAAGVGLLSKRALLVGEGRDAERALKLIKETADSGIKLVGVVGSKKLPAGSFMQDVAVVGTTDNLRELAEAFDVETIIVATSLSREPAFLKMLRPLRCSGIEILDYVLLYEMLAQEIPIDHINEEWLMSATMNSSVIHIRKMKRILDFIVAGIGLLLASPLILLAIPLIKLDSPGPVFYRQKRSGRDGYPYMLIKFRTMRQDAEAATGPVWSVKGDQRITRIGNGLRKWRIDEIPQLINVLKGEMSLVGPRPERPEFVETLSNAIPFYGERLMVPPGVTGWAQVKFPYASNIEGSRRKLQFDLYYIKHMGLLLDCMILLRTVKTVIMGVRHHDQEMQDEAATSSQSRVINLTGESSAAGSGSDDEVAPPAQLQAGTRSGSSRHAAGTAGGDKARLA